MDSSAHRRERTERDQRRRLFYTPDATPRRQYVEQRSAPLLLRLRQAPRWLVALAPVGLLLAGLAAPPVVGAVAMLVLVALLGWLGYLSWPSLSIPGRLLRSITLVLLLALTALRLSGRI